MAEFDTPRLESATAGAGFLGPGGSRLLFLAAHLA
jgi:hypothetical protein